MRLRALFRVQLGGRRLAARVDYDTPLSASSGVVTAACVTAPTAVLVFAIYLFHLRQHDGSNRTLGVFAGGVVAVLAGTLTPVPELVAGRAVAALVAMTVLNGADLDHCKPSQLVSG